MQLVVELMLMLFSLNDECLKLLRMALKASLTLELLQVSRKGPCFSGCNPRKDLKSRYALAVANAKAGSSLLCYRPAPVV